MALVKVLVFSIGLFSPFPFLLHVKSQLSNLSPSFPFISPSFPFIPLPSPSFLFTLFTLIHLHPFILLHLLFLHKRYLNSRKSQQWKHQTSRVKQATPKNCLPAVSQWKRYVLSDYPFRAFFQFTCWWYSEKCRL